MGGIPIDILIFAIIAVLIFYKYTSVLGSKDDETDSKVKNLESPAYSGKVIIFPGSKQEEVQESTPLTLDQTLDIISNQSSFLKDEFIKSAKIVFKMIISAFTAGDISRVSHLLSPTVTRKFKTAIKDREENIELKLEEINHAKIVDASLIDSIAEITVQFISTQTLIHNGVSEGTEQVSDLWTFSKNVYNDDPVWTVTDITAATSEASERV